MRKGFQFGTRHFQCLMMHLAAAISFCIRSHLSVAIVSMTEKTSFNDVPVLEWDSRMKGTLFSSFYWGYLFVLIPAGRLCEKFGFKLPLVSAMLICGTVMVLTPFAALNGGFYWMVVTRIILGITQAVFLPTTNVFFSKWAPREEKGMLFCFVLGGVDSGNILSMIMAGALVDSRWGWPSVFYVFGGITILWALIYTFIGANSPQEHSSISEHEKSYILSSLANNAQKMDNFQTPWKSILSSIPFIAIIISHCASSWAYYTILFEAPTYINAVFGISMKQSGLITALPYVSSLIAGCVYAAMSYWLNSKSTWSRTTLLKSWNSFSHWGTGLAMCVLAFSGNNKVLAVASIVVAVTVEISCRNGFFSNHLDLAPNFAGTLMGISVAISTICTLSAPLYTGFVVTDPKSVFSWQIVFLTTAIVCFFGNVFFLFFANTEVQPWNFSANTVKPKSKGAISNDGMARANCNSLDENILSIKH